MIKMLLRWGMPYLVRELKKSQGIYKLTRVFLSGGSAVEMLRELTAMTSWEWDDNMIDRPVKYFVRDAIDDIDGDKNEGVYWYDFIIGTLSSSI